MLEGIMGCLWRDDSQRVDERVPAAHDEVQNTVISRQIGELRTVEAVQKAENASECYEGKRESLVPLIITIICIRYTVNEHQAGAGLH